MLWTVVTSIVALLADPFNTCSNIAVCVTMMRTGRDMYCYPCPLSAWQVMPHAANIKRFGRAQRHQLQSPKARHLTFLYRPRTMERSRLSTSPSTDPEVETYTIRQLDSAVHMHVHPAWLDG